MIDGLPSGSVSIYRQDTDVLHLTQQLNTCQNLGGNRLKCEWTKGTNLFTSNVTYYIQYTAMPEYDRYCGSVQPLADNTSWTFTPLAIQG